MVEKKSAAKSTAKKTTSAKASKPVAKKETAKKADVFPVETVSEYAIFAHGGKQYQAIVGQTIELEKIDVEAGKNTEFKEVLFRKSGDNKFEIGQPHVAGATVKATVLKHMQGPKVTVFKFRRRKKSRVKQGHRQQGTVVRVLSI